MESWQRELQLRLPARALAGTSPEPRLSTKPQFIAAAPQLCPPQAAARAPQNASPPQGSKFPAQLPHQIAAPRLFL